MERSGVDVIVIAALRVVDQVREHKGAVRVRARLLLCALTQVQLHAVAEEEERPLLQLGHQREALQAGRVSLMPACMIMCSVRSIAHLRCSARLHRHRKCTLSDEAPRVAPDLCATKALHLLAVAACSREVCEKLQVGGGSFRTKL